jgi:hypothetical protein
VKVRHLTSRNTGKVCALTTLPAEEVGNQAGTWFNVIWSDGFQSWVQASSVTIEHPTKGAPQ